MIVGERVWSCTQQPLFQTLLSAQRRWRDGICFFCGFSWGGREGWSYDYEVLGRGVVWGDSEWDECLGGIGMSFQNFDFENLGSCLRVGLKLAGLADEHVYYA